MSASISDAYKNKEYRWFLAYIIATVLAVKLGGVVGVLGTLLVLTAVYKVNKNPEYSQKKKFLLSSIYVIGGLVITAVAVITVAAMLSRVIVNPATNQILESTENYSFTATSTASGTVERGSYVNSEFNFKISPPQGWGEDHSDPETIVQFDEPDPNRIGIVVIASDADMGDYSSREYAAGVMQGFVQVGAKDVKVSSQGEAEINGEKGYIVEFEYNHPMPGLGDVPMRAISASIVHGTRGYNILAVAQIENWDEYAGRFTETIQSFQFLE